ncbi:MAG: SAM-dependent methyltransferase [Clostridia bacterium]|nr:SAM-dependent methyltransferase [Clostridia bacterium]
MHMDLKNLPLLDARLALAASFVREGGIVADVGTDHAYLPIWLIFSGVCPRAVASDINEGPLQSARDHAEKYGVADRMDFVLADGLAAIDLDAIGVTDIAICGMGGEMIAGILDAAPYTRRAGVRCILQPMSSVEDLRTYLARTGYVIEDERLAEAAGRIYTCLAVSYDGQSRTLTPAQTLLGAAHIDRGAAEALFAPYLLREYRSVQKKYRGRLAGGLDTSAEKELLTELQQIAAENGICLPKE